LDEHREKDAGSGVRSESGREILVTRHITREEERRALSKGLDAERRYFHIRPGQRRHAAA
jgi:hypothetical protein